MARKKGARRPQPPDGWLVVADVGPAHGIRGEVTARLSGVTGDELSTVDGLRMHRPNGDEHAVRVVSARPKKDFWILAIDGVRDRGQAEACRDAVMMAPREALPVPDEDEWWVADLVGLRVETEEGEVLGRLEEVLPLPANDVFVVRGERGEMLLPVIDDVVREILPEEGRAVVRLLPGLLDAPEPEAPAPGTTESKRGGGDE